MEQLDSTIVNTGIPAMAADLGLPAWASGLLMMPAAAAAMFMKVMSATLLRRFGYRPVAVASLLTVFFLAELPQSDHVAVTRALHHDGYLTMAGPDAGLVAGVLVAAPGRWGKRQQGRAGATCG